MCTISYHTQPLMKGDTFRVVRFLFSDITQNVVVKIILWVTLLIHISTDLLTLYFMLYVFTDSKEKLHYLSFLIADFYPFFGVFVLIYKNKMVSEIKNEIDLWHLEAAGKKIAISLRRRTKCLTSYILTTFVIASCAALFFVPNLSNDINCIFVLRFLHDYYPNQYKLLAFIYKLTYVVFGYVMIVHPFQLIYYTQHIQNQWSIFHKFVEYLGDFVGFGDEEELFYNKRYQEEIQKRIRFCIVRSMDFLRAYQRKLVEMSYMIVGFSICGYLLGVSIIIFMFSDLLTSEYYPRQTLIAIAAVMTFCILIVVGQSVETASNKILLVLYRLRWYNFDKSNKTLYLIMLINMMRERKIQFTEKYSINYQLGLAIVRGLYSIITLSINVIMKK